MNIGILTYHRSHNYGALLQAVALRCVLSSMGHDVYYIDYWPDYHVQMYSLFSFTQMLKNGYRGSILYALDALRFYDLRKERISNMKSFIKEHIEPYCKSCDFAFHYDVLIYGSDQIWRKQPTRPMRFNPVYFGRNTIETTSHISYAASMGHEVLNKEDRAFLQKSLSQFTKLSVREEQLRGTLKGLGIDSTVVLDPTLLLTKERWERLLTIPQQNRGKYVLYYRLLEKSFDEGQIEEVAKRMNCKLVILDSVPRKRGRNILCTSRPEEFLSLIKHAEVVYTSSYHGLLFSIVFNKTVYASFIRNEGRARSLLTILGLADHLIAPGESLSDAVGIDYTKINAHLVSLREESLKYLMEINTGKGV